MAMEEHKFRGRVSRLDRAARRSALCSELVLSDQCLTLAKSAADAGYIVLAERMLQLAIQLLDQPETLG